LRLIDSCITQLKAQAPSRTCNDSKEEEEVLAQGEAGQGEAGQGEAGQGEAGPGEQCSKRNEVDLRQGPHRGAGEGQARLNTGKGAAPRRVHRRQDTVLSCTQSSFRLLDILYHRPV